MFLFDKVFVFEIREFELMGQRQDYNFLEKNVINEGKKISSLQIRFCYSAIKIWSPLEISLFLGLFF